MKYTIDLISIVFNGDTMRYNRQMAVDYARKWALSRNPEYYDYNYIGGDCTNFVSQCIYAGFPEMNYSEYGWYYINANVKSPSWTGVEFLYDFLINNDGIGPIGRIIDKTDVEIGDIIQLSFSSNIYGHTLIVSEVSDDEIYICCHTVDSKDRLLSTYLYEKIRYIKVC